MLLTSFGNKFHSAGPRTLKALEANVLSLTIGMIKRVVSLFDLSSLSGIGVLTSKFLRYAGARLYRHL